MVSMHMGIVLNPFGTGSSNEFLTDNPVVDMPDGSVHELFKDKNDTTRFIGKDFGIYKAVPNTQGKWELTLSDGTIYTFECTYQAGGVGYPMDGTPAVQVAQVTKIRNAANTASIIYFYKLRSMNY